MRFLLVLLLVLTGSLATAATVSEKTALRVADRWIPGSTALTVTPLSVDGAVRLYAVERPGTGWVIVSGSDILSPVLAYGYGRSPHAEPRLAPLINALSTHVATRSTMLQPHRDWRIFTNDSGGMPLPPPVESVGPLLGRNGIPNTWGQDAPYNKFTPLEGGSPTHVGCAAMSTGQILWYWEHPRHGAGTYEGIDYENTEYRWDLMPLALDENSPVDQIDAVATMLYHVGVAMNMRYHAGDDSPSLAYQGDITPALTQYFRYNSEYIDTYFGAEAWKETAVAVRDELDSIPDEGIPELYVNRPVQFNALKPAGHGFVCDGYENRGAPGDLPETFYFHFNFGWEGQYDGYFLLAAIGPVHSSNITFTPNYKLNYKIYPLVSSCDETSCSGHGTCQDEGLGPFCACDEGYTAKGFQCLVSGETPDDEPVTDDTTLSDDMQNDDPFTDDIATDETQNEGTLPDETVTDTAQNDDTNTDAIIPDDPTDDSDSIAPLTDEEPKGKKDDGCGCSIVY